MSGQAITQKPMSGRKQCLRALRTHASRDRYEFRKAAKRGPPKGLITRSAARSYNKLSKKARRWFPELGAGSPEADDRAGSKLRAACRR